jgi:hypothetical protein
VKTTSHPLRLLFLLGLGLLLGGCATYDAQVERGQSLTGLKRFFVVSNLNDNHALDHRIAEALKARGMEADTGPLTMMPDNAQVIITYQDRWSWDFGDHLVYLAFTARNAATNEMVAIVSFSATIPLHEPVPETVGRLTESLLNDHRPAHAGLRPQPDPAAAETQKKPRARSQ